MLAGMISKLFTMDLSHCIKQSSPFMLASNIDSDGIDLTKFVANSKAKAVTYIHIHSALTAM